MCDQTEVVYSPGDIVWVKLGHVWWPGRVHDYNKLPEEITADLKKKPIAVVKFFQEESFEYVKNLNAIYHYNCRRKNEFIKKGLDVIRSNNRDVPSNMKMFPKDIVTAEHLTHGNPDILLDEEFAPKEKEDYSELFGKKTPKKVKVDSTKKDSASWRQKSLSESSIKTSRHSLPTSTPRIITHRRFITKALEGRSDHEIRIRQQISERDANGPSKLYNCHLCGFSSSRINVIVLHNKSHSAGYADAYLHPQQLSGKSGRKIKGEKKSAVGGEKRKFENPKLDEPAIKKKNKSTPVSISWTDSNDVKQKETPVRITQTVRKPVFGRKKTAKDKAEKIAREKQENDAFRENLLKDWDDEDMEDNEEKDSSSKDNSGSEDKESSMDTSINTLGKRDASKLKETSCFDFDDSDDGLNIGETVMKFGQKIPRILGDKSKKQTKRLSEHSPKKGNKSDEVSTLESDRHTSQQSSRNKHAETKHTSETTLDSMNNESKDFDTAFKSLLDETAVPIIPDAPSHKDIQKQRQECSSSVTNDNDYEVGEQSNPEGPSFDDDGVENRFEDGGGGNSCEDGGGGQNTFEISSGIENISVKNDEIPVDARTNDIPHISESLEDTNESNVEEVTSSENKHFLVKTSEEVATSSSDNVQLEGARSPIENNVAESNSDNLDNSSYTTTKEVLPDNIILIEGMVKPECTSSSVKDTSKLTNIFENKDNFKFHTTLTEHKEMSTLPSQSNGSGNGIAQPSLEDSNFADMDFDINSMPVIIGDDIVGNQNNVTPMTVSSVCSSMENKLITVKPVSKPVVLGSSVNSNAQNKAKGELCFASQTNNISKDDQLSTRKVIISPTGTIATTRPTQVATIKVQPSSVTSVNKLSVPGLITQKGVGSTSQVLILKSAVSPGKSTLQKISNTSQLIQQGGKVLILTNPQGTASQNKIVSHKTVSPSKLTGTRILTTKGTVLTTSSTTIGKPSVLTGSSKTVTTKSGQKILINKGGIISQTPKGVIFSKSGLLTGVSPTILSGKSPVVTQNIITKPESGSSSQITFSQLSTANCSKGTNLLTTSGLTTSKGMVLAPVTVGKTMNLTNTQKLKLITSKASPVATSSTGTKLMIQSTQSRMLLPSSSLHKNQQIKLVGNLKGQPNTGTILIQTSQGVIATTPLTSNQETNKAKQTLSTVIPTVLSPSKPGSIQVPQAVLQSPNKLVMQKVKPGPNILQRTQKRTIQRSNKKPISSGHLLQSSVVSQQSMQTTLSTPAVVGQSSITSSPQDALILSSASGLPVLGQSNIVQGAQLDTSNQTALVYLTVDESGNYRPLESTSLVNYEGVTADSQTLYIDTNTTDLDKIFLAIDEAGNVVNIAQPASNTFATENSTPPPTQDILAKALANTQVLQQETVVTEQLTNSVNSSVLGSCVFVEQPAQYPQPSLSHSVLETSLTLNQPIMTPLEVPSAVSPCSLDQIASLSTGFLSDTTILPTNKKEKHCVGPSMPLLTEESDCLTSGTIDVNKNENVFYTQVGGIDGSQSVLTSVNSGSQLAFQLTLDENNVIVTAPGITNLDDIAHTTAQSTVTSSTHSDVDILADTNVQKSVVNLNNTMQPMIYSTDLQGEVKHFHSSKLSDHNSSLTSDNKTAKSAASNNLMFDVQPVGGEMAESVVIYDNKTDLELKDISSNHISNSEPDVPQTNLIPNIENETIPGEAVNQLDETRATTDYSNVALSQSGSSDPVTILNSCVEVDTMKSQSVIAACDGSSSALQLLCDNADKVEEATETKRHVKFDTVPNLTVEPSDNEFENKRIELEER